MRAVSRRVALRFARAEFTSPISDDIVRKLQRAVNDFDKASWQTDFDVLRAGLERLSKDPDLPDDIAHEAKVLRNRTLGVHDHLRLIVADVRLQLRRFLAKV